MSLTDLIDLDIKKIHELKDFYAGKRNLQAEMIPEILNSLTAYGGIKRYSHPKMIPYTKNLLGFSNRKWYILDLEKSLNKFNVLKNKLKIINQENKKILFVATKTELRGVLGKFIEKTDHFFVDNRWLGGTLTNFENIQKRIFLLQEMHSKESKGLINLLPKNEQIKFHKKKKLLELNLRGILNMNKLPDYLFIVDPYFQNIAFQEAKKLSIPVFAIIKTNVNPNGFEDFLPINNNSAAILEVIMSEILTFSLKKKVVAVFDQTHNLVKENKLPVNK